MTKIEIEIRDATNQKLTFGSLKETDSFVLDVSDGAAIYYKTPNLEVGADDTYNAFDLDAQVLTYFDTEDFVFPVVIDEIIATKIKSSSD